MMLLETSSQIDTLLGDVSSAVLKLAYSSDIYYKFINASTVQQFESSGVIQTMLNSLSESSRLMNSIVVRLKDGKAIFSEQVKNSRELYQVYTAIVRDYALSDPFSGVVFTQCYRQSDNIYFACLVPIYNLIGGGRISDRYEGAYVALCSIRNLISSNTGTDAKGRPIIIISENGSVIYADDNAIAAELIQTISEQRGQGGSVHVGKQVYQIRIGKIKATQWDIICAVPDAELRSELNQIRLWGVILAFSVVLVQLLMGFSLKQSIVRPLSSIVRQIHKVGTDKGKATMVVPDSSEIGILAADIKEMLLRIELMNQSVIETTRALYQAENNQLSIQIMFLKAQINPHFLYNNLECIRGMAAAGEISGVREITSTMATIYRYCVSTGQLATVAQELDIARKFFRIIGLRYQNRYAMSIDVDKDLDDRPIPKMTLQPILENAFLHGLAGSRSGGRVEIVGRSDPDGGIILSVSDNGHGMKADQITVMNKLLASPIEQLESNQSGIGIINVNSRIRLIYGNQSGITLARSPPHGLRVYIRIGQTMMLENLTLVKNFPDSTNEHAEESERKSGQ
jgi:two-component system sensor histidine kinase YesM